MVTHRPARVEELPYLQQRLNESHHEKVRLYAEVEQADGTKRIEPLVMCWVAEKDGKIRGMLPLRLIWQAEPEYIFEEVTNKSERRRIALGLPRIMEAWLGDRTQNKTGIYSYFFVTKTRLWAKLAEHFGKQGGNPIHRIYKGCMTFGRDL